MAKKNKKEAPKTDAPKTAPSTGGNPAGAATQAASNSARARAQLEELKKKTAEIDISQLTPEQVAQLQLEEAIRESNNPKAGLSKLRNPLSVKGCLLNILILVIMTIGITILISYIWIDKFDLGTVVYDMLVKFKIIDVWNTIVNTVKGWFSSGGGGGEEATAVIAGLL